MSRSRQLSPLPDDLPAATAALLRELRSLKDRSGFDLRALERSTYASRSSWCRWLSGETRIPIEAVETMARLCGGDLGHLRTLWHRAEDGRRHRRPAADRATPGTPVPSTAPVAATSPDPPASDPPAPASEPAASGPATFEPAASAHTASERTASGAAAAGPPASERAAAQGMAAEETLAARTGGEPALPERAYAGSVARDGAAVRVGAPVRTDASGDTAGLPAPAGVPASGDVPAPAGVPGPVGVPGSAGVPEPAVAPGRDATPEPAGTGVRRRRGLRVATTLGSSLVAAAIGAAAGASLRPAAVPSAPRPAHTYAQWTSRGEVMARVLSWHPHGPHRVAYSQFATFGGYRTDGSGYASMALGLPAPGPNSTDLAWGGYCQKIIPARLRPGDLIINPSGPATTRQVAIFDRWANAAHTAYWVYQQRRVYGTDHLVLTYSLAPHSLYQPYRPLNIDEHPPGAPPR